MVAPLAGAWIETVHDAHHALNRVVAPLAGAWIETCRRHRHAGLDVVAPLAGAWIETLRNFKLMCKSGGRAPRGRVD